MEDKLTEKTASVSEFSDPEKVTKKAGDESLATLDSDELEDSSATTSVVDKPRFKLADPDEVDAVITEVITKNRAILDYLKDK